MPQRDSWASALAPRLPPKARGLSNTQAAGISDASSAGLQQPRRHPYARVCFAVHPPPRFSACPQGASARFRGYAKGIEFFHHGDSRHARGLQSTELGRSAWSSQAKRS
jgi:hypothetical protein